MICLKLACGDKTRYVRSVEIDEGGRSIFVNEGHDDLYDQGFTPYELEANRLVITAIRDEDIVPGSGGGSGLPYKTPKDAFVYDGF